MSSSPDARALAAGAPLGGARASGSGGAVRDARERSAAVAPGEAPTYTAGPVPRTTHEPGALAGPDAATRDQHRNATATHSLRETRSPGGRDGAGFATLAYPAVGAVGVDSDAVQRGYAAGLARGRARAERELAERAAVLERDAAERRAEGDRRVAAAVQRLELAASALDARVAPVLDEAERTLGEAALALAAAVVGAELSRAPGEVTRTVLDAVLARPEAADLIAVRMHPLAIAAIGDPAVTGPAAPIVDRSAGPVAVAGVRLVADPSLAVGDAVGELPDGLLDATIAGALERAKRALLGEDA